jgi:hypothetical protein
MDRASTARDSSAVIIDNVIAQGRAADLTRYEAPLKDDSRIDSNSTPAPTRPT